MNSVTTLRIAAILALQCASAANAQDSLAALERAFAERRAAATAAAEGSLGFDDYTELSKWFAQALEVYVRDKPEAEDRVRARLTLVEVQLGLGAPDAARAALAELDGDRASMLELLRAADLAGPAGLPDRRTPWIDAATAKPAPFVDRMRAGMLLMTRLQEVARADRLFADAMKRAADDEARAEVAWHIAAATREREDRPEGGYERALEHLAKQFATTRFGAIARDRLRAMAYRVGDPVVDLAGVDLRGKAIDSAALRGKVVLFYFWASWFKPCIAELAELAALRARFESKGFEVFGISLDENRDELADFLEHHPHPWPDLFDGGGLEGPHALRSNVEQVPSMLLVDRAGKIAALRLTMYDADEIAHVAEVIERALAAPK